MMTPAEVTGLRRYNAATAHLEPPFAILDLAAMRANAGSMARRAAGKPIRLASKSVRCRAVLSQVLAMDGFRGIMAYTLPEALWLAGSAPATTSWSPTPPRTPARSASWPAMPRQRRRSP